MSYVEKVNLIKDRLIAALEQKVIAAGDTIDLKPLLFPSYMGNLDDLTVENGTGPCYLDPAYEEPGWWYIEFLEMRTYSSLEQLYVRAIRDGDDQLEHIKEMQIDVLAELLDLIS